ncbi:MAG: radical SAM protein [Bifidobacterium sp.]|nr:radical SAM protein [Bifidobacterium sp.]
MAESEIHYRRSRYAIISPHRYFKGSGVYRLVYLTTKPRLLALSAAAADAIEKDDCSALSAGELSYLVKIGMLIDDEKRDCEYVSGLLAEQSQMSASRTFVLMPTSLCNMECSYCGQRHCPLVYSQRVAGQAKDAVVASLGNDEVQAVDVRWYGGEPLMAYHRILELSSTFVDVARKTRTAYQSSMTTNGSLMTFERLRTLYESAMLRKICVTIDGYGEFHNKSRKMRSGRPTYQLIINWLMEAVEHIDKIPEILIIVRINITVNNASSIMRLLHDLYHHGLSDKHILLQLIPVYNWGHDNSDLQLDSRSLNECMEDWLREAVRLGLHINMLPTAIKQPVCIATNRFATVIDSKGQLYSCSEHPLVSPYDTHEVLGYVDSQSEVFPRPLGKYDDWPTSVLSGKVPCSTCPFFPVCGGACPKRWYEGEKPCPIYVNELAFRFDILAEQHGYRVDTGISIEA